MRPTKNINLTHFWVDTHSLGTFTLGTTFIDHVLDY